MPKAVLEVIATSLQDASAAVRGGADRLEVASGMDSDGLTPLSRTVAAIQEALPDVPLRIMLRSSGSFHATPAELEELIQRAQELRDVGASAFVFGFITPDGQIDTASTGALADAVAPAPWTFHHAFDAVRDPIRAWQELRSMTGVDLVLTAGSTRDLDSGVDVVCARAPWQREHLRFLAGGGLREQHAMTLGQAGITQFHVGRGARTARTWTSPVDANAVRRWRVVVDGIAHSGGRNAT